MRGAARRSSAAVPSIESLTEPPQGVRQSDCKTKTSAPRTFSRISMRHSSFLKRSTSALPTRVCIFLAISSASSRFEVPLEQQRRLDHARTRLKGAAPKAPRPTRRVGPPDLRALTNCHVHHSPWARVKTSRLRLGYGEFYAQIRVGQPYALAGDQPAATAGAGRRRARGDHAQTLLGVTGSGKTMAMARVVELVQKPTLVLCHNKTLAAQLCAEFRDFLPHNAVEYFVSYFDYYQPEAYIAHTDTYIAKDSSINDEIERLRHAATQSLLTRPDTLIVASVSCIYGLGSPADYMELSADIKIGDEIDRDDFLRKLIGMQYRRNDLNLVRGTFRVRGDTLEFVGVEEELVHRIEFFGDEIEAINVVNILTGEYVESKDELKIFPAKHYITPEEKLHRAIDAIEEELVDRLKFFKDARQTARSAAARDSARATTSTCCARSATATASRTTRAISARPRSRLDAVLPARLLPQGLAAVRRRVARDDPAGRRDVRRRPLAQGIAGRARFPACRRRSTTGR